MIGLVMCFAIIVAIHSVSRDLGWWPRFKLWLGVK